MKANVGGAKAGSTGGNQKGKKKEGTAGTIGKTANNGNLYDKIKNANTKKRQTQTIFALNH